MFILREQFHITSASGLGRFGSFQVSKVVTIIRLDISTGLKIIIIIISTFNKYLKYL